MKHLKTFIIVTFLFMAMTACGNKEIQEEEVQEEQSAAYTQEDMANMCMLRAYKIGKQSYDIIDLYGTGEMSQAAAAKLLKMNYEELAELKDLKIYSEYDQTTLVGLHANTMQAFNDIFDDVLNLIDDQSYLKKCLDRYESGGSKE